MDIVGALILVVVFATVAFSVSIVIRAFFGTFIGKLKHFNLLWLFGVMTLVAYILGAFIWVRSLN